jgi:hypothetical protein
VFCEVLPELLLLLQDDLHEEREYLSGAVVNDVEVTLDGSDYLVIDELVELHLVVADLIVEDLESVLNPLVDLGLLQHIHCQLRRMEADVDQLKAQLLQFVLGCVLLCSRSSLTLHRGCRVVHVSVVVFVRIVLGGLREDSGTLLQLVELFESLDDGLEEVH